MRSIARLLGVEIAVPGFSTLSRRCNGLTLRPMPKSKSDKPVQLVVDSTGLKIFGKGDWCEQKHKTKRKRRSWRKLHLGLDLVSGEIVCSDLTKDHVGDPTALPGLLDQVDGPVDRFLADGGYDREPTSDLLAARFASTIEVTTPPPKNAIPSPNAANDPTARDCHIDEIESHKRMAWQKATGYNHCSRGDTLMGRWKAVHWAQAKGGLHRMSENRS